MFIILRNCISISSPEEVIETILLGLFLASIAVVGPVIVITQKSYDFVESVITRKLMRSW